MLGKSFPVKKISSPFFHYASANGEVENSINRKNLTITSLNQVINPERYINYQKLLCITAYVCRFIKNLTSSTSNGAQKQGKLDIEEVHRVEIMWLRQL